MLTGYVDLAVRNKPLISVLAADPGVIDMLRTNADLGGLIERQIKLFADLEPGSGGLVNAAMVLAGAAGPRPLDLDDDLLRQHLVEAGRRTLGLRTPRRPTGGCRFDHRRRCSRRAAPPHGRLEGSITADGARAAPRRPTGG